MSRSKPTTILLTQGDLNGIGSEIIFKSFPTLTRLGQARFVVVGSARALAAHRALLDLDVPLYELASLDDLSMAPRNALPLLNLSHKARTHFGKCRADAGDLSMRAVELAAKLCLNGEAAAMVTAPINKEAIAKAGWKFEGHTDFLAHLSGGVTVQMLLADERARLRVALATVHLPLSAVAARISRQSLTSKLDQLVYALQSDFGIKNPRIALLGLNPHASDGGVIGSEETEVINPTLKALQRRYRIDGVFAADGFFGARRFTQYDAVLAMYHDQALIPFKLLAFETGVNVTLGLPFIRTSPDHGTAFDIAGSGVASPSSFIEAAKLALRLAQRRAALNKRF